MTRESITESGRVLAQEAIRFAGSQISYLDAERGRHRWDRNAALVIAGLLVIKAVSEVQSWEAIRTGPGLATLVFLTVAAVRQLDINAKSATLNRLMAKVRSPFSSEDIHVLGEDPVFSKSFGQ